MKRTLILCCGLLFVPGWVLAQEAPIDTAPEAPAATEAASAGVGVVLGLRSQVGFAQVFSDLGVTPAVELEVGYRLPFLGRRLGFFLAGGYQYTYASGSVGADDRLVGEDGTPYPEGYGWDLDEHAAIVTLGFFGRFFADTDAFSPYAWVGPRMYLLQSVINGASGGQAFGENTETSTEFGVAGGIGIEWVLGPGPLFVEIEIAWSPLDHAITGDSSTGQLGLALGYRILL